MSSLEVPQKMDLLHLHSNDVDETQLKLTIAMVGLPARGKTYTAKKMGRYLTWLGYNTKVFTVSDYRRMQLGPKGQQFFDNTDEKSSNERLNHMNDVLEHVNQFYKQGGQAAIIDASNTTRTRRAMIHNYFKNSEHQGELMWVEIICDELEEIDIASTPDYEGMDPAEIIADINARIAHYLPTYETLDESDRFDAKNSYVKIYNKGERIKTNGIEGYLPSRLISFIMNLRSNKDYPIFFSRHGQSEYNLSERIGGDPDLTLYGAEYAEKLGEYMRERQNETDMEIRVWCSTLRRTIQTAAAVTKAMSKANRYTQRTAVAGGADNNAPDKINNTISHSSTAPPANAPHPCVRWRALAEIEAGVHDGLTYADIEAQFPDEFAARAADKLRYRYPRGESYLDVNDRLEPVIFELERSNGPVLVIGHQAVLRCLYGYFLDLKSEDIPRLSVPLHTVIKIHQRTYGCIEERFDFKSSLSLPNTALASPAKTKKTKDTMATTAVSTDSPTTNSLTDPSSAESLPSLFSSTATPVNRKISVALPGKQREKLVEHSPDLLPMTSPQAMRFTFEKKGQSSIYMYPSASVSGGERVASCSDFKLL